MWKSPYTDVRTMNLMRAHPINCQNHNLRMKLCLWVKTQINTSYFSTVWIIVYLLFELHYTPPKCKMLDWLKRFLRAKELNSNTTSHDRKSNESSFNIQKTRLAFASFRYLWFRCDIQLSIKSRVYIAAVLLYKLRMWPLSTDFRRLSVFEQHCLQCVSRPW